jgi:hypothetical protein
VAFVVAHAQPSPSNSPNMGRRRIGLPARSAFAIVVYLTVRVPVMFAIGWNEQMNV